MSDPQVPPVRLVSADSGLSLPTQHSPRKLRLLIAATGPRDTSWARPLVVRLCKDPGVEMRAVVDDVIPRLTQTVITLKNGSTVANSKVPGDDVEFYRQQAFQLAEWADILVLAPLDVDGISSMVYGAADTLLLAVIRGWDVTKKILLVPGMSTLDFRNPMTKKHLSKIHRKWPWVRTMSPILWHYESNAGDPVAGSPKRVVNWNGFDDLLGVVKNQAELMGLGREVDFGVNVGGLTLGSNGPVEAKLPPEIWTIILEFVGDWELAQALGIFTTLPMPEPWTYTPKDPDDARKVYEHELSWTVLTSTPAAICRKISQSPADFNDFPAVVSRLIMRFSLVEVLAYLEANRPTLFKAFDGRVLPRMASIYYARTPVLEFWKQSAWFRDKHAYCYDAEMVDGASENGHVRVLEWWWRSGLPMKYTEAALEQASGNGHILVLAWWKDVAVQDEKLVLKPGRSLLSAAQHGQLEVLRWWEASGIPISHEDAVAKMASRWGQVGVLELWRTLKGDDKFKIESDVLVGPTVHAYVEVLEWWKQFARGTLPGMDGKGQRVEYRTCDIEEALEDSIGDQSRVRAWWEQNGLNLGLKNMEWMKTRYL
jgi:hypothetical protein